jgi:hypothetical protein
MLLLEGGKQVISNETKGGQPPFAFPAVISLKTGWSDYLSVSIRFIASGAPDYLYCQLAAPHHAPNIDSCTTNAPSFVYGAT